MSRDLTRSIRSFWMTSYGRKTSPSTDMTKFVSRIYKTTGSYNVNSRSEDGFGYCISCVALCHVFISRQFIDKPLTVSHLKQMQRTENAYIAVASQHPRTSQGYQLHVSTARRRLKSPQSLRSGTSTTPPTMVTHRSWSRSWMIDSHPLTPCQSALPFLK